MISFKEYLNQKTLNEDINKDYEDIKNDPAKNLILKWVNKNGKKIRFTGLNSKEKQEVLDELNKEIEEYNKKAEEFNKKAEDNFKKELGKKYESVKELNDDFENIEKIISNKSFNSFGDIDKADNNNFKKLFFQSILNEKDSIAKLNGNKVRQVVDCFSSSNKDGDKKIDKEEFVNAVKKIQIKFKGNLEVPAIILWLLYLKQNSIEKNIKIFNNNSSELPAGSETIAYLKDKDNFYVQDGKLNSNFEDLNLVFKSFENLQIDKSVLKNFKNINSSKSFLNKNIDEVKDEIKGNFTLKTQAQKDEEKTEDELRKTQDDINDTQARIDAEDKKIKEIEDGFKSPTEETGDPTKGNWFSLDVDLPEPGDNDGLNNFISSVKKAVDSELKKIVDEVQSYQIKKKKNDLEDDETQKEDIVLKIIKQKGFKILKEDSAAGLDSGDEEIDEWLNTNNEEIRRIISKYSTKLKKINDKLEASDSYSKSRGLRLNFKFMLTDFGKEINNSLLDLKEGIRKKVRNLRNKSWDADLSSHKSLKQQEEDNFNIKKIMNLLTSAVNKDHLIIAKIMLINILRNINDSEKVVELLNAPNFESLKNYIYSGNTNSVYAMDSNSVEAKDGMYIFNSGKAKIYKNPRDLLNAAGINIDELTVDVMKGLKKELKVQAEKGASLADEYKKAEQELLSIIQKMVQPTNASVVSEGIGTLIGKGKDFLLDKKRRKNQSAADQSAADQSAADQSAAVQPAADQSAADQSANQLENYVKEINLPDDYDPKGTTVKSVILRQTFKGYILIKKDNKWYVGSYKDLNNIKKALQPQQSSVVTSGAADSTYGDGYNYSKKADAIKKKLNCTTYTYSPNPKMKIVRRTFD